MKAAKSLQLQQLVGGVVDEAGGRTHRHDSVAARTGGPAGNARLTAWTGLVLLILVLVEVVTTLDVHGMLTWHVAVGTVLVPVALVKTASTAWRIVRYYTGNRDYVRSGPPPTLLRVLGPLVVLGTLGVLGTGIALIALGADASRRPFLNLLGQRVDVLTLHQGFFIVFAVATGLHLIARFVPALLLATGRVRRGSSVREAVPGSVVRHTLMIVALAAGAVAAIVVVAAEAGWRHDDAHFGHRPDVSTYRPQ